MHFTKAQPQGSPFSARQVTAPVPAAPGAGDAAPGMSGDGKALRLCLPLLQQSHLPLPQLGGSAQPCLVSLAGIRWPS